jgi:DNA primase
VLIKSDIISLLNNALNQTAKIRKGGDQACYYCKCGHYKRKLEVSLEDFIYHCWVCNSSGNLFSLFKLFDVNKVYYNKLETLLGGRQKRKYTHKEKKNVVELPSEFHSLAISRPTPEYRNAIAYLKRRNVFIDDIIRYNIGYCEDGDYENHIIIPSYDAKGNLNFFIGRRYYDVEGTISYRKPNADMNIVGFESFINWKEPLNLCEGVFDAFAIRNNAIPLFGKFPSKKLREQIILNKTKRINIILDSDAYLDALNIYEKLKQEIPELEIGVAKLEDKDPSVIGFAKTRKIIKTINPLEKEELFPYKVKNNL